MSSSLRAIDSLTSLRGLAALWIVLYHFWSETLELFPTLHWLSPFIREGHYAVPLFFMLSGFVLAYNYGDSFGRLSWPAYRRFVVLRFARIYPVHLFTLLIVLVLVVLAWFHKRPVTDAGYTLDTFIENVFLVQTWVPEFTLNWNYPAWSISSEWFAYLWFPLLATGVLGRIRSSVGAVVLLAVALLGSIGLACVGPLPFQALLAVIPTFIAGALANTLWQRAGTPRMGPRWLPDLCAAGVIAAPFVVAGPALAAVLISLFLGLMLTLPSWRDVCSKFWRFRALIFLGEVSYSLYMTHTLAQKMAHVLLPTIWFQASAWPVKLGILLVYAGLIAAACLTTYWLVERPCREICRRGLRGPLEANFGIERVPHPALVGCADAPAVPNHSRL